jgi:D-serine deaminase-like pyridoxal phosphate-dependent protein
MDDFSQLTTPAFLVDRAVVERNCERMRKKAAASDVIFRPHVKTHKTVEIARMQHGGEIGPVTVSTLAEAEQLAEAGWRDLTYAVPIAPGKLPRVAELAQRVDRMNILIDTPEALQAIESSGHAFDVFLKVDCGTHRAGVDPNRAESLDLARAMAASKAVRCRGLLTHAGHSYAATSIDDILRVAAQEASAVTRFRERIGDADLVRSVGSTPTASVVERFTGADEVRPGNYVFYDAFQATIGSCAAEDVAVSVLATVIGVYPERDALMIDAGALALSKDLGPNHIDPQFGYGLVCDLDGKPLPMRLETISQEHGKIRTKQRVPVGTQLRIVPNHSCLTAAMYDVYHVVESGRVVAEWRPVRGW